VWPHDGRSVALASGLPAAELYGWVTQPICHGGAMHTLLRLFGLLLLGLGLLFMAQGSGYLPWPKESFMIGDRNWVFYGGAIAAVGFLLIFVSR
jgi:hypothetical protein